MINEHLILAKGRRSRDVMVQYYFCGKKRDGQVETRVGFVGAGYATGLRILDRSRYASPCLREIFVDEYEMTR